MIVINKKLPRVFGSTFVVLPFSKKNYLYTGEKTQVKLGCTFSFTILL